MKPIIFVFSDEHSHICILFVAHLRPYGSVLTSDKSVNTMLKLCR